jgi:predicted histidine transporter YuiF (NhaC family)
MFPNNTLYFVALNILVLGGFATWFAAISNIYIAIYMPEEIALAAAASTSEKISGYMWIASMMMILPYMMNILTFYIYDKTNQRFSIGKKQFEGLPWWKKL